VRRTSLILENGRSVCETCLVADRPFGRMRGLLGRRSLPSGEGLLLRPAGSVHTFFMRFPIDVVFLDRDLTVLDVTPALRPWRTAARRGSKAVLELPAGESERRGLRPGLRLSLA
jgi:uncharacterized membrane protein (UPF0127 family)